MGKFIDITGNKYNNLLAVKLVGKQGKEYIWEWLCDCGASYLRAASGVKYGNTKSCGCRKKQVLLDRNTSHGMSKLPEYKIWKDMKKRIYNPNNKRYQNYLEKGVKVCDEWLNDFAQFYEDMGARPSPQHSIGRIDNFGWYCPSNCRWEIPEEQARNHSLQENNTTGYSRISFYYDKQKNILGYIYRYSNKRKGEHIQRSFTFKQYGDNALDFALAFKEEEIIRLAKEDGIVYADTHGKSINDVRKDND